MDNLTDHDLLVRIDERTQTLHTEISDVKCALSGYVTRKEFTPIKSVVYGIVGLIGTAVIGALLTTIIR